MRPPHFCLEESNGPSRARHQERKGRLINLNFSTSTKKLVIIKAASGPRYVVGCRSKLDKSKLKLGTRVALDMTTFTIMRMLPREVDPMVYSMGMEDPGAISFAGIGGLSDQIRELREVGIP